MRIFPGPFGPSACGSGTDVPLAAPCMPGIPGIPLWNCAPMLCCAALIEAIGDATAFCSCDCGRELAGGACGIAAAYTSAVDFTSRYPAGASNRLESKV